MLFESSSRRACSSEILRGAGAKSGSAHLLAFELEDLAPWVSRLAAAEVSIDDRTELTLYVRDPDGHRVGLTVYRGW